MSTLTTRLGLYKPATTGENVNVSTDLNGNLDDLDGAIGFRPVTSGTMPGAPAYDGECVHQTDTDRFYVGTGGAWLQILTEDVAFADQASFSRAAGTDTVMRSKIPADTQYRFSQDAAGKMLWGAGGVTAPDTNLFRTAADVLRTDDTMQVGGDLVVTGIGGKLYTRKTADANLAGSSTTLQDITGLSIALLANASYWFKWKVFYSSPSNTPDLKCQLSFPAGATGLAEGLGVVIGASGLFPFALNLMDQVNALGTTWNVGTLSAVASLTVEGIIHTTNAGTFKMQGAQRVADANLVTIKENSHGRLERVG